MIFCQHSMEYSVRVWIPIWGFAHRSVRKPPKNWNSWHWIFPAMMKITARATLKKSSPVFVWQKLPKIWLTNNLHIQITVQKRNVYSPHHLIPPFLCVSLSLSLSLFLSLSHFNNIGNIVDFLFYYHYWYQNDLACTLATTVWFSEWFSEAVCMIQATAVFIIATVSLSDSPQLFSWLSTADFFTVHHCFLDCPLRFSWLSTAFDCPLRFFWLSTMIFSTGAVVWNLQRCCFRMSPLLFLVAASVVLSLHKFF